MIKKAKPKSKPKGRKRVEEVEIKGHKFVKIFSGKKLVKMLTDQEYELQKK